MSDNKQKEVYELRLTQKEFEQLLRLDREARLFRPVNDADFRPFEAFVTEIIKADGGAQPMAGSDLQVVVVKPDHIIKEIKRLVKKEG